MGALTARGAAGARLPIRIAAHPPWLAWTGANRRLAAALGLVLIALLAVARGHAAEEGVATAALLTLILAVGYGWLEVRRDHVRERDRVHEDRRSAAVVRVVAGRRAWWVARVSAAAVAAGCAQTWFHGASAIAGGDLFPPFGMGWIGRAFAPWSWSGANLGGPASDETQLPWAAVMTAVHGAGGSPALAQRLWVSGLFAAAAVAAVAFLQVLDMRPLAAFCGAAVYVLNPYVASWVGPSPVYLATLALLPALPAAVLAAARGRCSVRTGALLIGLSAPFIGYAYQVPPLVGMLVATLAGAPLLAGLLDGRRAAARGGRTVLLGASLLLVLSAYWLVPSLLQLDTVSSGQLVGLDSWAFTEVRATLGNAFWLNTMWSWNYPGYVPVAPAYSELPLSLVKMLLPLVAFGALVVSGTGARGRRHRCGRHLGTAVTASTVALFLIVLSTGTRPPAGPVFVRIYQLPLGWLLREPGRFLMLAGLAYAVLVAIVVDSMLPGRSWRVRATPTFSAPSEGERGAWTAASPSAGGGDGVRATFPGRRSRPQRSGRVRALAALALTLAIAAGPGYPLAVGAVVPGARGHLPDGHVLLPAYWDDMASYVNNLAVPGGLLVLPPDDFYQMPYSWGYYGSDEFVPDMFDRRTLIPSPQGYFASSAARSAAELTAESILAHNWTEARHMLDMLGVALVLVRGDITGYPDRAILSPVPFSNALTGGSSLLRVHTSGPLELFATSATVREDVEIAGAFATVDSPQPDLSALAVLPPNTYLVSSPPRAGSPLVVEPAPLQDWQEQGGSLRRSVQLPAGWHYRLETLTSTGTSQVVDLPDAGGDVDVGPLHAVTTRSGAGQTVDVTLALGRNRLVDGGFDDGLWGPVQNCKPDDEEATGQLTADVVDNSDRDFSTLRLSATGAIACEARPLAYHGGSLLVRMLVRHVSGEPPTICLLQDGASRRCAPGSAADEPSPQLVGWTGYRAVLNPDPGTRQLTVYLTAQAGTLESTVNDYAQVRVTPIPVSSVVIVGQPLQAGLSPQRLVVQHESYSERWEGGPEGTHVVVDGLLNGWLVPVQTPRYDIEYSPSRVIGVAFAVSAAGAAVVVVLVLCTAMVRVLRRTRRR